MDITVKRRPQHHSALQDLAWCFNGWGSFPFNKSILFSLELNHGHKKASILGFVEALKLFLQRINGGCQPDLRTDDPEM